MKIDLPLHLAREELMRVLTADGTKDNDLVQRNADGTVTLTISETTCGVLAAIDRDPVKAIERIMSGDRHCMDALLVSRMRAKAQLEGNTRELAEIDKLLGQVRTAPALEAVKLTDNIMQILKGQDPHTAKRVLTDVRGMLMDKIEPEVVEGYEPTRHLLEAARPGDSMFGFHSENHRPLPSEFSQAFLQLSQSLPKNPTVEAAADEALVVDTVNVEGAACDRYIWRYMAHMVTHAQVFDFGRIDDQRIRKESTRGAALYAADHLRLPFACVIYWYTFRGDPETYKRLGLPADLPDIRYATVALDATRVGMRSPHGRLIMAADFCVGGEGITLPTLHKYRTPMYMASAGIIEVEGPETWKGRMMPGVTKVTNTMEKGHDASMLGGLMDGVMALTMMLNTKGLPLRREEPSPQLNAKRARNKKPPLVAVTYVDTHRYNLAAYNTDAARTHASPVPHLRRGHLRRLRGDNGQVYKELWVRDSLINCRSIEEVRPRDRYEVET